MNKHLFNKALASRTRYACPPGSHPGVAQVDAAIRPLAGKNVYPCTLVIGGAYHVFVGTHATRASRQVALKMKTDKNVI